MGWWFQIGRRSFLQKKLPVIEDPDAYGEKWVLWWKKIQPSWRDLDNWPGQPDDVDGNDWGCLLNGGKDGLFVVIVSLGWWILAQDPADNSTLLTAIKDVDWVINGLISSLSTPSMSSPDPPLSPSPSSKRSATTAAFKVGPPKKRPRV